MKNKHFEVELVSVTGGYLCRPAAACGSCGSYPFLWTAVYGTTAMEAESLFRSTYVKVIYNYENSKDKNDA